MGGFSGSGVSSSLYPRPRFLKHGRSFGGIFVRQMHRRARLSRRAEEEMGGEKEKGRAGWTSYVTISKDSSIYR